MFAAGLEFGSAPDGLTPPSAGAPNSLFEERRADSKKGVEAKWERWEAAMAADRRSGLVDVATPLWTLSRGQILEVIIVFENTTDK